MTLLYAALMQSLLISGGTDAAYPTAYAEARETGRPLVVLVGADWCPGCRTMKQSTMPQLLAGGVLSEVAYAQVNTDREGALASKMMSGSSIPQLVMYYETAEGWQRKQLTGAQPAAQVEAFLKRGIDASRTFVAAKKAKDETSSEVAQGGSTGSGVK